MIRHQLRNMVIVILAMIIGITVGIALVKMLPGPLLQVESPSPQQTPKIAPQKPQNAISAPNPQQTLQRPTDPLTAQHTQRLTPTKPAQPAINPNPRGKLPARPKPARPTEPPRDHSKLDPET